MDLNADNKEQLQVEETDDSCVSVPALEKTVLDRGWTECISLTHDLDLHSISCELWP